MLDRIASLGSGLSPGQRNDWSWFKDNWDKKMAEEHTDEWGTVFAGWMEGVLQNMGEANNAFSLFVYNETLLCFSSDCGLVA